MKIKVFIATSLCLLSGWLGLAYFHQVDMASYSTQEEADLELATETEDTPAVAEKLPQTKGLGTIVAE